MQIVENELNLLVTKLGEKFRQQQLLLAVAESCTGGGISQSITAVLGSSSWFDCGFITYSNASKIDMLAVNPETLAQFGAVSEQVAVEMVTGVLLKSRADSAVSVTGVAGPSGGGNDTPIGTVFIAWKTQKTAAIVQKYLFNGNRHAIRQQTIVKALQGIHLPSNFIGL
jgi:nicotinamide-nucleotide amidase